MKKALKIIAIIAIVIVLFIIVRAAIITIF